MEDSELSLPQVISEYVCMQFYIHHCYGHICWTWKKKHFLHPHRPLFNLFFYLLVALNSMWNLNFLTRNRTRAPELAAWHLNDWTTREVSCLWELIFTFFMLPWLTSQVHRFQSATNPPDAKPRSVYISLFSLKDHLTAFYKISYWTLDTVWLLPSHDLQQLTYQ